MTCAPRRHGARVDLTLQFSPSIERLSEQPQPMAQRREKADVWNEKGRVNIHKCICFVPLCLCAMDVGVTTLWLFRAIKDSLFPLIVVFFWDVVSLPLTSSPWPLIVRVGFGVCRSFQERAFFWLLLKKYWPSFLGKYVHSFFSFSERKSIFFRGDYDVMSCCGWELSQAFLGFWCAISLVSMCTKMVRRVVENKKLLYRCRCMCFGHCAAWTRLILRSLSCRYSSLCSWVWNNGTNVEKYFLGNGSFAAKLYFLGSF